MLNWIPTEDSKPPKGTLVLIVYAHDKEKEYPTLASFTGGEDWEPDTTNLSVDVDGYYDIYLEWGAISHYAYYRECDVPQE